MITHLEFFLIFIGGAVIKIDYYESITIYIYS